MATVPPERLAEALPAGLRLLLPSIVSASAKALAQSSPAELAGKLAAELNAAMAPPLRRDVGRLLGYIGADMQASADKAEGIR